MLLNRYHCSHLCVLNLMSIRSTGGAVVGISESYIQLLNSTCSNNICQGNGGCAHILGDFLGSNSTISGNEAAYGAGIYTDFGATARIVYDSVMSDNVAQQSGAGCFAFGANQDLDIRDANREDVLYIDTSTAFANNRAGCCYASGYGSKQQSNASSGFTCADFDTGI
jgi:hypothetical protein